MSTDAQTAPPQQRQKRSPKSLNAGQGRRGILLVSPTLALLAVVILYPLVKAVLMSFQKDSGLDKATGMFVEGGFAGLQNYRHWLLQECQTPTGVTSCPPGSLGSQFYDALFVTLFFTVTSEAI